MSSVVLNNSACRAVQLVLSFHVYREVKTSLYPTSTVSLGTLSQHVSYRNIIQSCELGSQGQISPSVQILKEKTWIMALLARNWT